MHGLVKSTVSNPFQTAVVLDEAVGECKRLLKFLGRKL